MRTTEVSNFGRRGNSSPRRPLFMAVVPRVRRSECPPGMNTIRSLALLLACTLPSLAALPLTAIKEYQESAPEFIDLQVTKVIKTPVW